jgi:hypothetical protein
VKGLKKAQSTELSKWSGDLDTAFQDLDEACIAYNEAVGDEAKAKAKAGVEAAIEEYNKQIVDANDFLSGIGAEIREYIDGKSEKWQESDKASDYEAWAEEWEQELDAVSWDMLDCDGVLDVSGIENPSETIGNLNTDFPG